MNKTTNISHIIMMGDSLSDTGTMNIRKLFYFIPMSKMSGLGDSSPKGRFTNGYSWNDRFNTTISEKAIIEELNKQGKSKSDMADDVITKRPYIKNLLRDSFNLDSNTHVNYKGQDFVRNYSEGGLTSFDYSRRPTANIKLAITQKILSTLDGKRRLLMEDDKVRLVNAEHKKESLIIEWSGANDLITVNEKPTYEAADKAVQARLHNVEELIKNGYQNYVLFSLPDLSLTPRFQSRSVQEQNEAHEISMYFNQKLNEGMQQLQVRYPTCNLDVYDVNKTFAEAIKNPEQFHLDPKKLFKPFKSSEDFKQNKSQAKGYMFWDDVHPTAAVHAYLEYQFYEEYSSKYNIAPSKESLVQIFREQYGQKCKNDSRDILGFFKQSRLDYKKEDLSLDTILKHALYEGGTRTKNTLIELGWINKECKLISKDLSLIQAMNRINAEHNAIHSSKPMLSV